MARSALEIYNVLETSDVRSSGNFDKLCGSEMCSTNFHASRLFPIDISKFKYITVVTNYQTLEIYRKDT